MIAATPGDPARRPTVARRMVRLPRFQSRGPGGITLGAPSPGGHRRALFSPPLSAASGDQRIRACGRV